MLKEETKQLNILDMCKEGILCIDDKQIINFSNNGAHKIFKNNDLLNKSLQEIHPESYARLSSILQERGAIKLKINGENLVVISSPVFEGEAYKGSTLMLIETHIINKATCNQMYLSKKEKKRTFLEIRRKILITLFAGKETINQIAIETGINWKTVEKHLTHLLGKKLICEVYNSEYLRIFDLSEKGNHRVEELRKIEKDKLIYEE